MNEKRARLIELYLAYYRLLVKVSNEFNEQEKIKAEISNLAKEIVDEEEENGEELC